MGIIRTAGVLVPRKGPCQYVNLAQRKLIDKVCLYYSIPELLTPFGEAFP